MQCWALAGDGVEAWTRGPGSLPGQVRDVLASTGASVRENDLSLPLDTEGPFGYSDNAMLSNSVLAYIR